jgi:hypothetical protein
MRRSLQLAGAFCGAHACAYVRAGHGTCIDVGTRVRVLCPRRALRYASLGSNLWIPESRRVRLVPDACTRLYVRARACDRGVWSPRPVVPATAGDVQVPSVAEVPNASTTCRPASKILWTGRGGGAFDSHTWPEVAPPPTSDSHRSRRSLESKSRVSKLQRAGAAGR